MSTGGMKRQMWCALKTVALSSVVAVGIACGGGAAAQDADPAAVSRGDAPAVGTIEPAWTEALVARELARWFADPEEELSALQASVRRFYDEREYRPAWISAARDTTVAWLARAERAHREGLCALPYPVERLRAALHGVDRLPAPEAAALDLELTETIAAFLADVAVGRHREASTIRDEDLAHHLHRARDVSHIESAIEAVAPPHQEYAALRRALHRYQEVQERGGWPYVPDELFLRPGSPADSETLELLWRRLALTGDVDPDAPWPQPGSSARPGDDTSDVSAGLSVEGELTYAGELVDEFTYDDELVDAVRRFQQRHGLQVDGIIGPQTVRAMNVPVDRRVQQIALNMDRWRRLPDRLGNRHVRVNIPDFRLSVVDQGREVLTMRTVVGRVDRQTPVFSDRITYLEFSPYWNVPDRLARRDILPRVVEDPSYLERQRFDVLEDWSDDAEPLDMSDFDWEDDTFRYRLRQRPGPGNALGLVKFMFPNQYAVYLHDSPSRARFERRVRTFSSGCVRVARPVELAEVLLENWSRGQIEEAMAAGERTVVRLPSAVPVHLWYMTAWVSDQGDVHFRQDVYARDARAVERIVCEPEKSDATSDQGAEG